MSHDKYILDGLGNAHGAPPSPESLVLSGALSNPMQLESPLKLTSCFTERCNLNCRLCYADCNRPDARPELSGGDWIDLLTEVTHQGIIALYFEGGEPFVRPDFMKVIQSCARRAFTMIRTNGTLISQEVAQDLKQAGVGLMFVDLWGADAATHDSLTGVSGSFDATLAGIRRLTAAGLPVQTLFILNRLNHGSLPDNLRLSADLGAEAVSILRLYPLGRTRARWSELALSLDEQMAALHGLEPPPPLRLTHSWHPNDHNCCWQMAAVNAYGDSIGCAYLREYVNYGNIREIPFRETWDHPLWRELRSGRVKKACSTCSSSQGSHGGCRAAAYAFTGEFDAPDPFDITLNNGTDLRVLPSRQLRDRSLQDDAGPACPAGGGA